MMEVAVGTGAARRAKLQSKRHHISVCYGTVYMCVSVFVCVFRCVCLQELILTENLLTVSYLCVTIHLFCFAK